MATIVAHILFRFLTMSPIEAAEIAAEITGADRRSLVAVARRESANTIVSIHDGDAWASRIVCSKSKSRGWIDPELDCRTGGWSTRGSFGLMAGYHLRFLGLTRWPWVLDYPLVSAYVAGKKWMAQCRRGVDLAAGWCP